MTDYKQTFFFQNCGYKKPKKLDKYNEPVVFFTFCCKDLSGALPIVLVVLFNPGFTIGPAATREKKKVKIKTIVKIISKLRQLSVMFGN